MTSADLSTDCKIIDAELDRGCDAAAFGNRGLKLSERALEHLRSCDRCRRLYEWINQELPSGEPSRQLRDRIQEQIRQSLRPVSPQPALRVLAARFLVVFLLFASPLVGMLGAVGLHEMGLTQLIGIGLVLLPGAALLSLSLAWQMTPGSLQRVSPRVAVLAPVAGFLAGTAILFPWRAPEAFLIRGWHCLNVGLLIAIPAALLIWLLVRRGHAVATVALGGTLGAMAGLLGASVLQLTCDRQDAAHLLVWHGGVLIISIGLGVLVASGVRFLGGSRA